MSREMIFSENEYDRMNYLMTAIMDAGELLAMHGAEVSRVEDTITRLCMAYGFVRQMYLPLPPVSLSQPCFQMEGP